MKLTLKASDLAKRLDRLTSVINSKVSLALLSCVRLTVTPSGYTVAASNIDMWMDCAVVHSGSTAGDYCIGSTMLKSALSSFGDSEVVMECDGKTLTIKEGKSVAKIAVLGVEDWPNLPELKLTEALKIADGAAFVDDLKWVSKVMLSDISRLVLNSVIFSGDMMLACDGKRSHRASLSSKIESEFIVPDSVVKLLTSMIGDASVIETDKTWLRLTAGEWTLTSKLLDGHYPLPQLLGMYKWDGLATIKVNKAEATTAKSALAAMTSKSNKAMRVTPTMGGVIMSAESDNDSLERWVVGEGELPEFAIMPNYFGDLISGAGDLVELRMEAPTYPLFMKYNNRDGLALPCKIAP